MKKQFHVVCADDERECLQLSVSDYYGKSDGGRTVCAGQYGGIVSRGFVDTNYNHYNDFREIHCAECIK